MSIIKLFLNKFKRGSNDVSMRYAFLHSGTSRYADTVVIIYKLRNCQDYDTDDLHTQTAMLFIHSGARRYVGQKIHSTVHRKTAAGIVKRGKWSTSPVQTLSAGPLSTMLNNSYLQKAYLERTTVPYTSITEEEYRLCIIRVLRPPLSAETDRIKVGNPSTTVAGKLLNIQTGTTRIQIHTKLSCSFL